MKKKKFIILIIIIICAGLIIWYFNTFTIKTNYEIIESEKIVDEITIIQISDLHGSSFGRNNKELIKKIEKEKPDIICVTGDMYTAKDEKGKQIALKLLQELAKSYKVYFVNGEHDCDEKFIKNLKDNEVNVLDYKKETIAIKNTKINLYGITNQYYSATFDLKNAFEINKEEYNILLAHISNFEEFEQFGIDLSLCGDTHGGQVRLPFLGAIINRGIWFPEIVQKGLNVETNYIKGLYNINNSYLYVSSGLGNYPISIRLFNRPEIAVIKLRWLTNILFSINELISGEKINDLDYKEKAEENLIVALENSTFTLKEKIEFHKKKWLKEHIFDIVLCIIVWLVVIVALKLQNAEGYLIGTISGILAVFFYVVRYNQMMIYVEDRVYKKIEK